MPTEFQKNKKEKKEKNKQNVVAMSEDDESTA
jgi:hypothetical protein